MSASQRIRDYLDSQNVPHAWLAHPEAFPAQEVAHTLHVSGKHFAKAIVVQADGRRVMAVLPASRRLNVHQLRDALKVKRVEMVPESELAAFQTCRCLRLPDSVPLPDSGEGRQSRRGPAVTG